MKRALPSIAPTLPLLAILAVLALLSGCASRPHAPPATELPAARSPLDARTTVVSVAHDMLGVPYRPGGSTPRGFDCSGLVSYSHGHAGIPVPRTAREQYARAKPVGRRDLLPGDLVFFNTEGRWVSHSQKRAFQSPTSPEPLRSLMCCTPATQNILPTDLAA